MILDLEERLRQHVLHQWRTCLAEATVLYRCVRELMFLRPRIERHFHYPEVLATIKSADPHARYLDLGCCFGTDTRRVVVDGWKQEKVVAVDVIPDFWNYGLQLYEDAATIKVETRIGDVTSDSAFVESLVAGGQFAHVWTGAVLHVLTEAKVEALLRSVFAMLRPGGSYFGTCVGTSGQPSDWQPEYRNRGQAYLHTAESLKELLERIGFVEVVVTEQSARAPAPLQEDPADLAIPKRMLAFAGKTPSAQ